MFPNMRRDNFTHHIYHAESLPVLKETAIYGANGAGKSNFVKALAFIERFATEVSAQDKLWLRNWYLDNRFRLPVLEGDQPVGILVEFGLEGSVYIYNVEIGMNGVETENLYISGKGKGDHTSIFTRSGNNVTFEAANVGEDVRKIFVRQITDNPSTSILALNGTLHLTDDENMAKAFKWFNKNLTVISVARQIPWLIEQLKDQKDVLEFVNGPAMRLVGSVGGNVVDESTYKNRIRNTDYSGININNGSYTGYPFDNGLLNPDTPDVITATYPLRAFINNTHYGDWPVPSAGGIKLDSDSIKITVTPSVEYKKGGAQLPADGLTVEYTNPETQQTLTLVEGEHFNLSYADNLNVGTAKVYISAIEGSGFAGSVIKTFRIDPVDITSATVVLNKDPNTYYFTGAPIEPASNDLVVSLVRADDTTDILEMNTDFFITYSQDPLNEDGSQ